MNRLHRRITFFIFVCSFFSIAGTLTFFMLGYRYSFERGVFVYTGSVTVAANPASVNIVIDRNPEKSQSSKINNAYHIAGLEPGEHFIEVSADGYHSWSKSFLVSSGVSTEFWNILLTRETYEQTSYDTKPIAKIFPSPKSTLVAFVSTDATPGFSVNTLDTDTLEQSEVFRSDSYTFDPNDKENIEWSVKANYLSVPAEKDGSRDYFIINNATKEVIDLQQILQEDRLQSVRWDSSRNTYVLALSGTNLYEIDITQPENKSLLASNVQGYDISGTDLYILESNEGAAAYKTSIDNPEIRIRITELPDTIKGDRRYSVIAYDENRLILINYFTGALFIHNRIDTSVHESTVSIDSARGAQFSDDGKKLLWWTDREMTVLFLRDWDTQPLREHDTGTTIGRFSRPIKNVHWTKDYEHISFSVDATIKVIELDNRGERDIEDILTVPTEPVEIISNFAENQLLYTLPISDNKNTASLHSINFPEKTPGFFTTGQ